MSYGRLVIVCIFTVLEHWRFIACSPVNHNLSNSEQSDQTGLDLRSLHFPREYHATGVLSLPTNDIDEPFEVWHSQTYDKSRIDYYHGKPENTMLFCFLTVRKNIERKLQGMPAFGVFLDHLTDCLLRFRHGTCIILQKYQYQSIVCCC